MNNIVRNVKNVHGFNLVVGKYYNSDTKFSLMNGNKEVAFIIIHPSLNHVNLSEGRTNKNYREKGYGKFLRALATKYAFNIYKDARYIKHFGANYENIVTRQFMNKHAIKHLIPFVVRGIARTPANVSNANLAQRYKLPESVVKNLRNHFETISTKIVRSLGYIQSPNGKGISRFNKGMNTSRVNNAITAFRHPRQKHPQPQRPNHK